MPSVRQSVLQELRLGALTGASPVVEVRGVGPYLAGRLARALGQGAGVLRVGTVWAQTAPMTTRQVERLLLRALQNDRANQCVPRRAGGQSPARYHAGDVNEHGHEALVALLDHARARQGPVRYGALARMPRRSRSSRDCGCRQTCDGPCVRAADGACVPRSHNARGFVGAPPHPGQTRVAATDAERRRVRRAAYTRQSPALAADPDATADLAAGHARSMRYSARGRRLWRHPSPKVRLPARA